MSSRREHGSSHQPPPFTASDAVAGSGEDDSASSHGDAPAARLASVSRASSYLRRFQSTSATTTAAGGSGAGTGSTSPQSSGSPDGSAEGCSRNAAKDPPALRSMRDRVSCISAELTQEKVLRAELQEQVDSLQEQLQQRQEALAVLAEELHDLASQEPGHGDRGARASSALYFSRKIALANGVCNQGWQDQPLSPNVRLSSRQRAARFVGPCKEADQAVGMKAFVGTSSPVWKEDGAYGFQVVVQRCRTDCMDGLAIGFCSLSPSCWPGELPDGVDELDAQLWLVGYQGEMCERTQDGLKWRDCPWNSSELVAGDVVALLLLPTGRLQVRVNRRLVCVVNVEYDNNGPPLHGVVDLLGNVDEVMLVT